MAFPLLHRLPVSARLPLAMVGIVLVTALGSTQISTRSLSAQVEAQLERIGQIYLDGMAASLMPSVLNQDAAGIDRALDEALRMHQGVEERRLFLLDGGAVTARADRDSVGHAELPALARKQARGYFLDADDGSYWIWRPLTDVADQRTAAVGSFTVVANLDVSGYVDERRALWRRVVVFDLSFGVICAIVGLLLVRRLLRPIDMLTRHLQQGEEAALQPMAEHHVPAGDRETLQLVRAYNRMAAATREREAMLTFMAKQEREAVLGRLTATLAHEVRNPLTGVITAIETLRKFGDREEVRAEALDFMERGMRALTDVTDATLATHRSAVQGSRFGPQDLVDIRRLVAPKARRAGVELQVTSDLEGPLPLAGGEVRQILLNLLLNAVEASPAGGRVRLHCAVTGTHLRLEISDEGGGLPEDLADSLERGVEPRENAGLGVAVTVRLLQRLQGRVAVDARTGQGTRIVLDLPLDAPATELETAP
ncbi:MAG: HAMP domain-containing sensor histidine kinase [Burkholderiaceae bacterium]